VCTLPTPCISDCHRGRQSLTLRRFGALAPIKIRVLLWQLIRGRLPSAEQVARRNGPSDGSCALCGGLEDGEHIFFRCHLARFMWAGVRELLSCNSNPTGVGDFTTLVQGLSFSLRRLSWFTFAALCWMLWNIRNKLAMEGKTISSPADALYKMYIYGGTEHFWTRCGMGLDDSMRERGGEDKMLRRHSCYSCYLYCLGCVMLFLLSWTPGV
jgi:hypothetical protein